MADLTLALEYLQRYWGYKTFWPLQERAVNAVLDGRDSLVVLPTGGGKSLCYQLPALCLPGMAVIVSPLIALMKDQVDGLRSMGVEAGRLTSGMDPREQRETNRALDEGRLKLIYVSPERLITPDFLDRLAAQPVSFIAVDEAHCISHWGHDFRPEYRMLAGVRERFAIPFHAYTATATERVRDDIVAQMKLRKSERFIGDFDRPNLLYRFFRRARNLPDEVESILKRHPNEAGIIYCITRKGVEDLVVSLNARGYAATGYHAGMDPATRDRVQDDFMNERRNLIVATIAFGMGIDRPDVRFVMHTGLPKSVEHYQQESGRAGRDGLPAECVIFFAYDDLRKWEYIIENSEEKEGEKVDKAARENALRLAREMYNFASGLVCRHQSLVEYFGQDYKKSSCAACDVCLSEHDETPDSKTVALKILSAVVRTGERFGGQYVAETLKGSATERVKKNGHEKLSTFGILAEETLAAIRSYIDQLEAQGFLRRSADQYATYSVTPHGWRLIRQRDLPVRLLTPPKPKSEGRRGKARGFVEKALIDENVPLDLFEALRKARREIAKREDLPPFIICHDKTLALLAARRPVSLEELAAIPGFGRRKVDQYGEELLEVVDRWMGGGEQV